MIVAHYIPKNFSDLMGERFLPRVGVPAKAGIARHPVSDSEEDISGRFELTDAAGVEKQVLSPHWPPTCRASPAKKFWYDTVCYGSKAAFTCALEAFGADHLVTGSDYPVLQDYETYKETFAYIERLALSRADVEKILHPNAEALFGFRH